MPEAAAVPGMALLAVMTAVTWLAATRRRGQPVTTELGDEQVQSRHSRCAPSYLLVHIELNITKVEGQFL